MTTNNTLFLVCTLAIVFFLTSCTEDEPGCTDPLANNYDPAAVVDDGSCTYDVTPGHSRMIFVFSHEFDGDPVTNAVFDQFNYVNANSDTLSITRLRYLISDVRLYKADGDSIVIDGYQLIDVTAGTGLTYEPDMEIPHDIYTGISFVFGFDSLKNIDNAYPDLNVATWNWPAMFGGGYHFMQMEGRFKNEGADDLYAYHNGTAKVSDGIFEQNYFFADLSGITLSKQYASVEVKMNIDEWYKNPNTWDLKVLNSMLMPNYTAQKMMQANGASVFSMGAVTQTD